MPGTNTLAHYKKTVNYDRKKFYRIGPCPAFFLCFGGVMIVRLRFWVENKTLANDVIAGSFIKQSGLFGLFFDGKWRSLKIFKKLL